MPRQIDNVAEGANYLLDILDKINAWDRQVMQRLLPPAAEAFVPANPARWPGFAAGSIFDPALPPVTPQDLPERLIKPFLNIETCYLYLASAPDVGTYHDRFSQLWQINNLLSLTCEADAGVGLGSVVAGAASNRQAEKISAQFKEALKPMDGQRETINRQINENLNRQINQAYALEQNRRIDPLVANGVGVFQENLRPAYRCNPFLPKSYQKNIFGDLSKNSNPLVSSKRSGGNGGTIGGPAITKGPFGKPFAFIPLIASCGSGYLLSNCTFYAANCSNFFIKPYGEAFLAYRFVLLYYDYCILLKKSVFFGLNLWSESCLLDSPVHKSGLDEFSYYIELGYF